MKAYYHRQTSPLHFILLAITLSFLVIALNAPEEAQPPFLICAAACLVAALSFGSLSVEDDRDALLVRFGPLPLFRKRIAYADMTAVEAARSNLLDGWGIHWVPGKGWIYNLWGFQCVRIHLTKKQIRVGTDDQDGLLRFLQTKIPSSSDIPV